MTIVPMRKVTVCGLAGERAPVLAALQELGCLHLIPLRRAAPLEAPDAAARRRADAAFAHLVDCPDPARPWPPERAIDLDVVIAAALDNKKRLRGAADRIDFLEARIAGLSAFGDFALPEETDALRGRRLWFYDVPLKHRAALDRLDLPWCVVGRGPTALHVAVIAQEEPPADILPVSRTHTGARRLSHLRHDLEIARIERERAEAERRELSRNRLALGRRLAAAQDADDLRHAAGMSHEDGPVFAVQGWAPADAAPDLVALAEARGLALTVAPPQADELPPTLMDTSRGIAGSEAITSFYRTPAYGAWDPSLIVFASFVVFFAMILADAGYAAALAVGLALAWARLGRSAAGRRGRTMGAILLAAAGAYGVAAGSYFGIAPPEASLLAGIAVIDVADIDTMMVVSICIGVAHISLANLVAARRLRGTPAAWGHLGWIAATLGGLALWLVPGPLGTVLLAGGLGAVVVAGGAGRRVERPADWLWRVLAGLRGLTRVSTLFGDVLSYMRLFALGLASASLAATFNGLAAQLAGGVPGAGVLLAILVLLLGHGVNLALGIVSGAVHGLRLNFIEFFGWGLTEEGYPFKAFARREVTE